MTGLFFNRGVDWGLFEFNGLRFVFHVALESIGLDVFLGGEAVLVRRHNLKVRYLMRILLGQLWTWVLHNWVSLGIIRYILIGNVFWRSLLSDWSSSTQLRILIALENFASKTNRGSMLWTEDSSCSIAWQDFTSRASMDLLLLLDRVLSGWLIA